VRQLPRFNPETNLIEFASVGEMDVDETNALFDALASATAQARKAGKPVLVLATLEKLGPSSVEARKLSGKRAREVDLDKAAIVAKDSFSVALTKLIMRAAGLRPRVRFFDDRAAATAWLKQ